MNPRGGRAAVFDPLRGKAVVFDPPLGRTAVSDLLRGKAAVLDPRLGRNGASGQATGKTDVSHPTRKDLRLGMLDPPGGEWGKTRHLKMGCNFSDPGLRGRARTWKERGSLGFLSGPKSAKWRMDPETLQEPEISSCPSATTDMNSWTWFPRYGCCAPLPPTSGTSPPVAPPAWHALFSVFSSQNSS